MRPRPVEIVIRLETTATLEELRRLYRVSDSLTPQGSYGKIVRVDVFPIKRLKATGMEGSTS